MADIDIDGTGPLEFVRCRQCGGELEADIPLGEPDPDREGCPVQWKHPRVFRLGDVIRDEMEGYKCFRWAVDGFETCAAVRNLEWNLGKAVLRAVRDNPE